MALKPTFKSIFMGATRAAHDDLDKLRTKRLDIIDRINTTHNGPIGDKEIEARVDRYLNAEEQAARELLIFENLSNATASRTFSADAALNHGGVIGVLICVGGQRDQIRARLIAEAKAATPGQAMTSDKRADALQQIRAELAEVEFAEEALIRDAERNGVAVARREDADPAIYLAPDERFRE